MKTDSECLSDIIRNIIFRKLGTQICRNGSVPWIRYVLITSFSLLHFVVVCRPCSLYQGCRFWYQKAGGQIIWYLQRLCCSVIVITPITRLDCNIYLKLTRFPYSRYVGCEHFVSALGPSVGGKLPLIFDIWGILHYHIHIDPNPKKSECWSWSSQFAGLTRIWLENWVYRSAYSAGLGCFWTLKCWLLGYMHS